MAATAIMTAPALYWLFLRAVLLSFSGFATVPVLRDALVLDHRVLTDGQLNDAIAISQASPGPLGMYLVLVGYFIAGLPGAVAGVLALITPAFLAIPISRLVLRGHSATLRGACSGVVIASSALIMGTGLRLVPQAAPSVPYLIVAVAGAAVVALTGIKPLWVIVIAAGIGVILR
jgi:chromate transporter